MSDDLERRSRLVTLAYAIIGDMPPPPDGLSDKEVFLALASAALKKAAEAVMDTPPMLPPPEREGVPDFMMYRKRPKKDQESED
jgi:hypothetical protein